MVRQVFGFSLAALLLIAHGKSFAEGITRDVWVFGVLTPSISRNKVQPFFESIAEKSGVQYRVTGSTDQMTVLDHCQGGEPAIVAASKPIADKVEQRCGYRKILVSRQPAMLFTNKVDEWNWANNPRIGFITNIEISDIAQQELKSRGFDYQPVYYRDFFDVIRFYKRDKLDALVMTELAMQSVTSFSRDKQAIYFFKQAGEAFVLIAPTVSKREIKNLIAGFVSLSTSDANNWIRASGMTGFEPLPLSETVN